jgi:hypothetical protein
MGYRQSELHREVAVKTRISLALCQRNEGRTMMTVTPPGKSASSATRINIDSGDLRKTGKKSARD